MKKIIVASNNQHKIDEIKSILSKYKLEIISLKEAAIDIEIEEVGNTFMENAYKKAKEIYNITRNYMVLADDSGLMVDCLGGAPGVYSARFSGEHGNTKENNAKLLNILKDKTPIEKSAKFVCAMVLIVDGNSVIKVQGEIDGLIIDEERGSNGFGYDPLFYVPECDMTFAQMDDKLKNQISHRAKALKKLKEQFEKTIQEE